MIGDGTKARAKGQSLKFKGLATCIASNQLSSQQQVLQADTVSLGRAPQHKSALQLYLCQRCQGIAMHSNNTDGFGLAIGNR